MILHWVKLTIQPLGVKPAKTPKKAQNGGGGGTLCVPLHTACVALI